MTVQCPKCHLWNDHNRLKQADKLGQGDFCNAKWKDNDGSFCSIKAAENHRCTCYFTEADVKLYCHRLVCTHSQDPKALLGTCQDFEPSAWLRKKFGVKP